MWKTFFGPQQAFLEIAPVPPDSLCQAPPSWRNRFDPMSTKDFRSAMGVMWRLKEEKEEQMQSALRREREREREILAERL